MDRLRQLLTHISAQLGVLTFSQRVAIGLCAVLVVASVFWLMQWSVEPEYVPLVKAEFEYDQLTSAEDALKAGNVKYVVRGQRIFVRAEDRPNVLRILHQADVVPGEQLFDMETLVVNQNPFMSPEARRNQENYALGNELAKIVATLAAHRAGPRGNQPGHPTPARPTERRPQCQRRRHHGVRPGDEPGNGQLARQAGQRGGLRPQAPQT